MMARQGNEIKGYITGYTVASGLVHWTGNSASPCVICDWSVARGRVPDGYDALMQVSVVDYCHSAFDGSVLPFTAGHGHRLARP